MKHSVICDKSLYFTEMRRFGVMEWVNVFFCNSLHLCFKQLLSLAVEMRLPAFYLALYHFYNHIQTHDFPGFPRILADTFRPTDTSRRHVFRLWRPGQNKTLHIERMLQNIIHNLLNLSFAIPRCVIFRGKFSISSLI